MKDVLLLHGALGAKDQLLDLEMALAGKYKVHAINFSGHGRTSSLHHAFTIQNFAHEVLEYMNKHFIQSAHVFGYSMGGYVALWLARFYPDRIDNIHTLGTKLAWTTADAEREIQMLNPEKIIAKVPVFAKALANRHGEHEWKSVLLKTEGLMRDLVKNHLTEQDFIQINNRVCFGLGEFDNMVSLEETEFAQRLLKNGVLQIFKNAKHPLDSVTLTELTQSVAGVFES